MLILYLHLSLKLTLPEVISPRVGHSAVVFGEKEGSTVVVLFGGNRGYSLSETMLLFLGESNIFTCMLL